MMSEIPWTPLKRTSSTTMNDSWRDTLLSTTSNNLSLGITIRASTDSLNFSKPCWAWFCLLLPSKENGFVTTPIVKIPKSLAILATTGAAPVPVPPPIPAVTNTISAPSIALVISCWASSAAFSPTWGSPPAPRPFVNFAPSWILFLQVEKFNTCKSVFINQNSTPVKPDLIILLTAFPPPPPTPITLIFAGLIPGAGCCSILSDDWMFSISRLPKISGPKLSTFIPLFFYLSILYHYTNILF